jgi:hypothetical protein
MITKPDDTIRREKSNSPYWVFHNGKKPTGRCKSINRETEEHCFIRLIHTKNNHLAKKRRNRTEQTENKNKVSHEYILKFHRIE